MSDRLPTPEERDGPCEAKDCTRPATVFTGGFSDLYLCRGHEIAIEAGAATFGEFAISKQEYIERLKTARAWFRENPDAVA